MKTNYIHFTYCFVLGGAVWKYWNFRNPKAGKGHEDEKSTIELAVLTGVISR